ncbi:MauE/DoxX family redox-associated membrane protein [Pedobacter hartonius]|uniref:Methylamine utilisation protein MauE domain-containing protein n=1 Tax=Pedobacter hartonius TaxID=425514 RepID=A0A1H4CYK5_9SPHI|nr:MauE/DoxX family redox-associated membrane protein [Pedobacter hartonius]SEA65326.1 hypothetical protein SAMN05443550_104246 [Pedobacter hartonius]
METAIKKKFKFHLSDKTRQIIINIIVTLFILLFIYAATSKVIDYKNTEIQLSKSPITAKYANILIWLIPCSEILIVALLSISRTKMLGLYASLTIMVVFTSYIYAILNFSDSIPCSCGGVLNSLSWEQHLTFNIAFISIAILGILLETTNLEHKTKAV